MGKLFDYAAAAASVIAGLYLLTSQTVSSDSFIEVIAHGMGLYFIAKGVFIGRTLDYQHRMAELLRGPAENAAIERHREMLQQQKQAAPG